MLEVDIRKALGAFSLDVKLQLQARVTALFGPSGAGKTSVLQCVAGLSRPDAGRVALDGRVLWSSADGVNVRPEHRQVGYVFQEGRLFPHLTVRANLFYGARAKGLKTDAHRATAVIELLGLERLLERDPRALSGGEQQRVAIGRAVLSEPKLLLLDEPLASLDIALRADVLAYVRRLRDELDLAMLYVSHDVEEVLLLADEVVSLAAGRVLAMGPPAVTLPASQGLRPLLSHAQSGRLLTHVREARNDSGLTVLTHAQGELKVAPLQLEPGTAVTLTIHPRDVILARTPPQGLSVRNCLGATISKIIELDEAHALVSLRLGPDTLDSLITTEALRQLELQPGTQLFALIKASAIEIPRKA